MPVRVVMPKADLNKNPMLKKFDGKVFDVEGHKSYHSAAGGCRVYTLKGAVSDYGLPYYFHMDWLRFVGRLTIID